jgi:hypothetical protein
MDLNNVNGADLGSAYGISEEWVRVATGEEWAKSQGDGTRRVDEWSRNGTRQADLARGDVGDESVRCAKFIRFI